jgi:hypothetical protein
MMEPACSPIPDWNTPPPSGVLVGGLGFARLRPLFASALIPDVLKFVKSSIVVNIDQPLRNPEEHIESITVLYRHLPVTESFCAPA